MSHCCLPGRAVPNRSMAPLSPRRPEEPRVSSTILQHPHRQQAEGSRRTNIPRNQAHPHLPDPVPPPNHAHPPNHRPPLSLSAPPTPLLPARNLHQARRPRWLRRRARGRRARVRQAPHLPDARARTGHRAAQPAAQGLRRRRLGVAEGGSERG